MVHELFGRGALAGVREVAVAHPIGSEPIGGVERRAAERPLSAQIDRRLVGALAGLEGRQGVLGVPGEADIAMGDGDRLDRQAGSAQGRLCSEPAGEGKR